MKNFPNTCNWFVDNKLSILSEEEKTRSILFGLQQKLSATRSLDIRRGTIQIK